MRTHHLGHACSWCSHRLRWGWAVNWRLTAMERAHAGNNLTTFNKGEDALEPKIIAVRRSKLQSRSQFVPSTSPQLALVHKLQIQTHVHGCE